MRNSFYAIVFLVLNIACKGNVEKENLTTKIEVLDEGITTEWVMNHIDSLMVRHSYQASNGLEMPYRLFSPFKKPSQKVPLIVFLHGRGDRGTDNSLEVYKDAGIVMYANSLLIPEMQEKYPCYILAPQCSDKTINEEWAKWVGNTPETPFEGLGKDGSYTLNDTPSESGQAALELIEKTIAEYQIDTDRVYITGLSMGGFGTWEFTSRRPDLFAAAIPMAGYSDPHQVENIKHIPFWIFHGASDTSNPVEGSRTMYNLLSEAGADVTYTEYKDTGHGDSFKKAFNEPGLVDWLFSKTKKQN